MLRVHSIFDSIQGESIFQGLPSAFVRLAGCPLRCDYCDTRSACTSEGTAMEIDEIVSLASRSQMPYVEVTGGEPLFQDEAPALLDALVGKFKTVLLETCGALCVEKVNPQVHIVMDIKCPGSGMSDHFHLPNLALLSKRDHELKFVITSRVDFDWSLNFCKVHGLLDREIVFSPATGLVSLSDIADWIVKERLDARLRLQLHKFIWTDAGEER